VLAVIDGDDVRWRPDPGMPLEPGQELVVVESADEAVSAYRELISDPAQAEEMGRRARERVLDEHTYTHRARRLLELVGLEVGVPV